MLKEKVYRRRDRDKPAAACCDIRLRYNGSTIVLKALSPAGQEWLAAVTESDGAGPVQISLMHLDTVLAEARRAAVALDTPWDQDDAGG